MAQNQYISLKVSGRPDSSGGYNSLILFNNPAFVIEDQDYVGFDNNSYFYSIKDFEKFTVYKLVKNNIRSYNGIRLSTIKIAFSVPNGYCLDNNVTPYDVLNKLKDIFLSRCLRCVDTVKETYEYISNRIEVDVLDDVVKEYTISQKPTSLRKMNPNSPIGYIVKPDEIIEEFFHDFNYPEFVKYSEIIIAEHVNQTNYVPINIQIPRQKSYEIWVNGKYQRSCTDPNETMKVSTQMSPAYYDNKTVPFTIQNLKDGDYFPGFELDEINEKVSIVTTGWATPKECRVFIKIIPKDLEQLFYDYRNLIKVETTDGLVNIDKDLSFTLIGEQISEISKGTLKPSLISNTLFSLTNYSISNNEIILKIERIKPQSTYNGASQYQHQRQVQTTALQLSNTSPVVDVQILIKDYLKITNSTSIIEMRLQSDNEDDVQVWCRQNVMFSRFKSGPTYEGHFYLPKKHTYCRIMFSVQGSIWKSSLIDVNTDSITLTDEDFSKTKKIHKWNRKLVIFMACIMLSLAAGVAIGYVIHDSMQSKENKAPSTLHPDNQDALVEDDISEIDIHSFLDKAENRLMANNVTFNEIQDFDNYLNNHSSALQKYADDYSRGEVLNKIRDYSELSQYIVNGNIDSIIAVINRYQLGYSKILKPHAEKVMLILKSSDSKSQFMNSFSNILGFYDIEDKLKANNSNEESIQSSTHLGSSGQQRTASSNSSVSSPAVNIQHFDCKECKDKGKPNYRYNSQEALNNHINKDHER